MRSMWTSRQLAEAERTAIAAAREAGALMRRHLRQAKTATFSTQHDIKLELDVRCQKRIEQVLRGRHPAVPVLGEEGMLGDPESASRWVVDPIDGTVNFAYGIPHACVSIALQTRQPEGYQTEVGVVWDPFTEEMFTARRGGPALLNGRPIRASDRTTLSTAIVALGFSKSPQVLDLMLPDFNRLVYRIRKVRIMGSAALSLVYVAAGRMDAYLEQGVRLWDIAAGGLILECAGGEFWTQPVKGDYQFRMIASNGRLRRKLSPYFRDTGP